MILHLDVVQPGNFSCDDGTILHSWLVCNNFEDCEDGTDETNCTKVSVKERYSIYNPPAEASNDNYRKLNITINVDIRQIFEICNQESFFEIFFITDVIWHDRNARFKFLRKGLRNEIMLDEETRKLLWLPRVEFDMIDKVIKEYEDTLFVLRESPPTMSGDSDQVVVREVYDGAENSFKLGNISSIKL